MVREENSRLRGRGFESPVYWMDVSDEKEKNKGSQMEHTKKSLKKNLTLKKS